MLGSHSNAFFRSLAHIFLNFTRMRPNEIYRNTHILRHYSFDMHTCYLYIFVYRITPMESMISAFSCSKSCPFASIAFVFLSSSHAQLCVTRLTFQRNEKSELEEKSVLFSSCIRSDCCWSFISCSLSLLSKLLSDKRTTHKFCKICTHSQYERNEKSHNIFIDMNVACVAHKKPATTREKSTKTKTPNRKWISN